MDVRPVGVANTVRVIVIADCIMLLYRLMMNSMYNNERIDYKSMRNNED